MKYTPIEINKRTRTIKGKKYVYYEARCTVQLAKKSYRETGSGKTRQAAKDALLKKLDAEEKKNLTSVEVKSDTLNDAIDHFLQYKLSEGWAASTYSRNQRTRENQIETYLIGMKHPLEVTHNDILEYLEQLRSYKYSNSTLDKAYSLLQLYFNYVYQDNRMQNPCYGIKIGYAPKLEEDHVLTSEEVARVFKVCDDLGGNADIIKFAFMTYERPGEVSTLKFSDWSRQTKTIKINRTYTEDAEGKKVVSAEGKTKTKTSRRSIKLSEMANDVLVKRYNQRWQSLGKRPGTAYIWTQQRDQSKPIDYNTLRRLFKKILKLAEVDKEITLHGLRHSGITFYGKDRDQFLTISKNAGHSRPSITEDIYSHVMDEHKEAAVKSADNLNKIFSQQ